MIDNIEALCNEVRKYDIGISRWYREQAHSMRICRVSEKAWIDFEVRILDTIGKLSRGERLDPFLSSFSRKDDTP